MACAGVVALIDVALVTLTPVAATPPNATVAPAAKFDPAIVTLVPPAGGPDAGVTPVTAGGAMYRKPPVIVAACVSGFATVMSTVPAPCAGVVAVMVSLLTTTTFVAVAPPTVTVAPVAKFAPEIVT